ncbi:MAG: hypothetical protein AAFV88_03580 [Planctomycetota bacterium]
MLEVTFLCFFVSVLAGSVGLDVLAMAAAISANALVLIVCVQTLKGRLERKQTSRA